MAFASMKTRFRISYNQASSFAVYPAYTTNSSIAGTITFHLQYLRSNAIAWGESLIEHWKQTGSLRTAYRAIYAQARSRSGLSLYHPSPDQWSRTQTRQWQYYEIQWQARHRTFEELETCCRTLTIQAQSLPGCCFFEQLIRVFKGVYKYWFFTRFLLKLDALTAHIPNLLLA